MSLEDLVEPTLKGALLVTGVVVTLVSLAQIAIGVTLVSPYWYWKWKQEAKQTAIENQLRMEHEAKLYEINKQDKKNKKKRRKSQKKLLWVNLEARIIGFGSVGMKAKNTPSFVI